MSFQCCSCGAQTEVEQSFRKVRRSFQSHYIYYCPPCWTKRHQRIALFQLPLWGVLCLVSIVVVMLASEDSVETNMGWIVLNFSLIYPVFLLQILPHELGHALAARLLGWRVFKIALGEGRNLFRIRCGTVFFEINTIPTMGYTEVASASAKCYRLKRFLFVLAGPSTNTLFLIAILLLVPPSQLLAPLPSTKLFLWLIVIASCILLLMVTLCPFRMTASFGSVSTRIDSDGLALLTSFFLSTDEIRRKQVIYFLLEGAHSYLRNDFQAAKRWYEKGLECFPEDISNRFGLAFMLLFLKEFHAARAQWLHLLENELPAAMRTIVVNNLAWTDMVIGGKERLAEADQLSQEVVREEPKNSAFLGTRGSILIELGDVDKGLPLVRQAFDAQGDHRFKTLHACYLALGECRRGDLPEAQRWRDLAWKLDPGCFLLDRVDQTLGEVFLRA